MTSLQIVPEVSFVKPHFIKELGEEGLTLHEVAKSINIEFKHAKEKIERMIEKGRITVAVYTTSNETNGLDVKSYYLNTDNAKFFVAKWDSDIGDAYTKFLIQCEKAVEKMQTVIKLPTQLELAKQVVQLLEQQEHQIKALETSQQNNAKLTKENKKLRLNLQGKSEYMSINQYKITLGIKSNKCTNRLVQALKEFGHTNYEKRILGDIPYPTCCFNIEFLEEQTALIKKYFE